jgi:hypothetical protein
MLKRYTFWLWVAVVFQLLTALAHSLSFVATPVPNNETEKQLIDLMTNYRMDMGAGMHRSTNNLFMALSACFPLLYIFGALTNIYWLKKRVEVDLLRGFLVIQIVVFGVTFAVMVLLTFLPPITLTGLVFLFLAIAFFTLPKERNVHQNK